MIVKVTSNSKSLTELEPLFSQSIGETMDPFFPGECDRVRADVKIEGAACDGSTRGDVACKLLVRVSESAIFVVNNRGESVKDAFYKAIRKLRDVLSRRSFIAASSSETTGLLTDERPLMGQKVYSGSDHRHDSRSASPAHARTSDAYAQNYGLISVPI